MDIQPPATCGIPTHPTCTALAVHGRARRGRAARLRGWVAGAVLALVAPPVLAQTLEAEGEGAAAIAELIQSGDHEAAYELALERRAELEGRPVFDFWCGVAALDAGHVSESIFALERVSMHRPGSARVRLELARGYFLAGEDRRARQANMVYVQELELIHEDNHVILFDGQKPFEFTGSSFSGDLVNGSYGHLGDVVQDGDLEGNFKGTFVGQNAERAIVSFTIDDPNDEALDFESYDGIIILGPPR